jgi:ankyrin repeat protein
MSRELTPGTSLDSLKKEAKRWLKAVREHDAQARARLARAYPNAPAEAGLRDVQHALALEHGVASWARLKAQLADARLRRADVSDGSDGDGGSAGGEGDSRERVLQALLAAADRGDAARVIELLDANANASANANAGAGADADVGHGVHVHPDIVNERGALSGHSGLRTALHFGVRHEAVVAALLARGADPNVRDEGDAAMPLHFAAERQDLNVIRLLIEHGADPIGADDHHELDVIGWATGFDYLHTKPEVVDYLLAHGARHNIFSAVAMGDVDSIRALAARAPADLDKPMDRTNHRRRPLHLAVVKKQTAALAALLELGADAEAQDEAGLTPLDQAALAGEAGMARLLVEHGAEIRLPAAVALGRTDDIERLLRQEPDCLKPGHRWGTLIVRASERAPGEVIETLIRFGASVDAWDDPKTAVDSAARFTPLHAAAARGNAGAAAALLKHGANPCARELKYCSGPAGWAAYCGYPAVRDLILASPIDLFEALAFDLTDRIAEILARDPQALNRPFGEYAPCEPREGQWWPEAWCTPLAWAVIKNQADAARILLAHGAELTVAPDGRTLHAIASEEGREQIAELLRAHAR